MSAPSCHLQPDLLGFRGGVCHDGDRTKPLDPARVRAVAAALAVHQARRPAGGLIHAGHPAPHGPPRGGQGGRQPCRRSRPDRDIVREFAVVSRPLGDPARRRPLRRCHPRRAGHARLLGPVGPSLRHGGDDHIRAGAGRTPSGARHRGDAAGDRRCPRRRAPPVFSLAKLLPGHPDVPESWAMTSDSFAGAPRLGARRGGARHREEHRRAGIRRRRRSERRPASPTTPFGLRRPARLPGPPPSGRTHCPARRSPVRSAPARSETVVRGP